MREGGLPSLVFGRREGEIPSELCPDSFFRCAAFPLREIADPTGAGDTFLGAIAGYLASEAGKQSADGIGFESIRKAVVQGSVLASFTCEAFSTKRLEELTGDDLGRRHEAFRRMSAW